MGREPRLQTDRPAVGGDIDAFCSRCKLDLGHTVVAMVGSRVVQVICNTCGSHHRYRQPRADEVSRSAATALVRRKRGEGVKTIATARAQTVSRSANEASPPPPVAAAASANEAARPAGPSRTRRAADAHTAELKRQAGWEELWREQLRQHAADVPTPYTMARAYVQGDLVAHERYGVGVVQQVPDPKKMAVLFRTGLRTLVMNYAAAPAKPAGN